MLSPLQQSPDKVLGGLWLLVPLHQQLTDLPKLFRSPAPLSLAAKNEPTPALQGARRDVLVLPPRSVFVFDGFCVLKLYKK